MTRTSTALHFTRPSIHFGPRRVALFALAAVATSIAVFAALRSRVASVPTSNEFGAPNEAARQFEGALLAWQDGAPDLAFEKIQQTLAVDPNFAEAHLLALVMWDWSDSNAREHCRRAVAGRAQLTPPRRNLLEALTSAMGEELNLEETRRQLSGLASANPDDAIVQYAYLVNLLKLGAAERALAVLDGLRPSIKSLNVFMMVRGFALALGNDVDATRQAFEICSHGAPNATNCLTSLADLEAYEGHCDASERASRRFATANPQSPEPLKLLARALYGKGAELTTVRNVFEQRWTRLEKDAPIIHAERAKLDILEGRFDDAAREIEAWEKSTSSDLDEATHADPAELAALLAIERGDVEVAANIAERFDRERERMIGGSFFNYGVLPVRVLHLAGRLSNEEFRRRRQKWLTEDAARGPYAEDKAIRWLRAYAQTSVSPPEATEALAALPSDGALSAPAYRPADQDDAVGRTFFLAGHIDEAMTHLKRGVASCSATDWPIEQTWAYRDLGYALEVLHRPTEACGAYAVVVARWGSAVRSTSARDARSRMQALSCENTNPRMEGTKR